jgi:predicted Zn-dependent protease
MRTRATAVFASAISILAAAPPAFAQLGGVLNRAQQVREQVNGIVISDQDEQQIGAGVSEKVRTRYGVAQDPAVHKYVSLVGLALAKASTRPNLPWTFIVLDTDGVNAFAAPGGYIHITRGALALVKDEAELAGVLAHEITHVTEKHTISAIQKNKLVAAGANETLKGNAALLNQYVDKAFELVYAGFGRGEELEADSKGIVLVNKVGYGPAGLGGFLTKVADRNKSSKEKQGLFASHPEMQERLDKLSKQISSQKLASTVTMTERYKKAIAYQSKPLADVGDAKSGAFAVNSMAKPAAGTDKRSAEVTGSGASRGVDTERNAKGGDNPQVVRVTVSAADLAAFKQEGGLH